jgi:hypothetical protein
MENKISTFKTLFLFILMIFVMIIVLKTLNWIPISIRNEEIRKYKSLEEENMPEGLTAAAT